MQQDKTLRPGDMVTTGVGLEVVKRVDDGEVSFAKASAATTKQVQAIAKNSF